MCVCVHTRAPQTKRNDMTSPIAAGDSSVILCHSWSGETRLKRSVLCNLERIACKWLWKSPNWFVMHSVDHPQTRLVSLPYALTL